MVCLDGVRSAWACLAARRRQGNRGVHIEIARAALSCGCIYMVFMPVLGLSVAGSGTGRVDCWFTLQPLALAARCSISCLCVVKHNVAVLSAVGPIHQGAVLRRGARLQLCFCVWMVNRCLRRYVVGLGTCAAGIAGLT